MGARGLKLGIGLARILALLLLVFTLLLLGLLRVLQTDTGRNYLANLLGTLSGGDLRVQGLSGDFPAHIGVAQLQISSQGQPWLVAQQLAVDWRPQELWGGHLVVSRMQVDSMQWTALPPATPKSAATPWSLPLPVQVQQFSVNKLQPIWLEQSAELTLQGSMTLTALDDLQAELRLQRLDQQADYALHASLQAQQLELTLTLQEADGGLLAQYAGLPQLGAVNADARVHGPRSKAQLALQLHAGALQAQAEGWLNLEQQQLNLTLSAKAPAMQPSPTLAWQNLSVDATIAGPWLQPTLQADVQLNALRSAAAQLQRAQLHAHSEQQQLLLRGELDGLQVTGLAPQLLAQHPLALQGVVNLAQAPYPLSLSLQHPLLQCSLQAQLAVPSTGQFALNLPSLQPFQALLGVPVAGNAKLAGRFNYAEALTTLELDANLGLTAGDAYVLALLGKSPRLQAAVTMTPAAMILHSAQLRTEGLNFSATGGYRASQLQLDWQANLANLARLPSGIAGSAQAQGQLAGTLQQLALTSTLQAEVGSATGARIPLTLQTRVDNWPSAPQAELTATAQLAKALLFLQLHLQQAAAQAWQVQVQKASWRSASAAGQLLLSSTAPAQGQIKLHVAHLADVQPLLGQPLSGSLNGTLALGQAGAHLQLIAGELLSPPIKIAQATASLWAKESLAQPKLTGTVSLQGMQVGEQRSAAQLQLAGTLDKLQLNLAAQLNEQQVDALKLQSAAVWEQASKQLLINQAQLDWHQESLRLLQPVQMDLAHGLNVVQPLRLGLRDARLELSGQVLPQLALHASAQAIPLALLEQWLPALGLSGQLSAAADLSGTWAQPQGLIRIDTADANVRSARQALPPLALHARAELQGKSATLSGRLNAGTLAHLTLAGELPLQASGALQLQADGRLDLSLLNSWLNAEGKRLRGQLTFAHHLTGTWAQPQSTLQLQLQQGEYLDYGLGLRLSDMQGTVESLAEDKQYLNLTGKLGKGSVQVHGNVNLWAKDLPVTLQITADDAQLLSSEQLQVNLDSALQLNGAVFGQLMASGDLKINRAELRIPERWPANSVELTVHQYGESPQVAPTAAPSPLSLALTLAAPRQVFVRGRGIEAELGGTLQLQGSPQQLLAQGALNLQRGQYTLAGKVLQLDQGQLDFAQGTLLDPALNFSASSRNGTMTATLQVAGTARKPKITLSSVPEMPQDEVLTYLLFNRSSTTLSPMEMLQIASVLASLSGVQTDNPLDLAREKLGLDRLSVGGANGSPTLEAGRYIAPGTYVGVKQGTSSSQTQATVQVDISKGFKIEGTVGTQSTPNSANGNGSNGIGLLYQTEY